MKTLLLSLHRWLALLLTPLFLLILLSGMVLAFKPIVEDLGPPPHAGPVALESLLTLLEQVPAQVQVKAVERSSTPGQWILAGAGEYRLQDGVRVGSGEQRADAVFAWFKGLHRHLLIGAGWLVEWGSWAMLAIMLAGLLLGWPRFSHTLAGWHRSLGAWLLPLALLLPLTGVLMSLHLGRPDLGLQPQAAPTALAQGLRQAAAEYDLSALVSARAFKGGSLLIDTGQQTLVVSGDRVSVIDLSANWPKRLHEGLWGGWVSGVVNLLAATLVTGLTLTGLLAWLRRRRAAGLSDTRAGAEVLVVFASQTGTAQGLAAATVASLQQAGILADQGALAAVAASRWADYRQVLVIASTTGEGEVPDHARGWLSRLAPGQLAGARFSLLALGDRRYRHFCAGGERLQQALLAAGAEAVLPLRRVDGEPSADWRDWLRQLAAYNGWSLSPLTLAPQRQRCEAQLIERVRLDRPVDDAGPQSYGLTFRVPEHLTFAPGDLFQFRPRPDAAPRTYSIGSASAVTPGRVRLTVGLLRYTDADGQPVLGLGSSELCLHWPLQQSRPVELVAHAGFNPPADPARPLILVATGCGIAPFIGFLEARAAAEAPGPLWLLFGNRHAEADFLYGEQILAWHQQGVISELDTLFSRDGGEQRYITERLASKGAQLLDWIERGAALYICGRASTLGRSIDQLLQQLLIQRGLTVAAAQAELERWSRNGLLHRDLFD